MRPHMLIALIALLLPVAWNACYVVTETEQVVITQFGRIIGPPVKNPGLKFKIPFLQKANYLPRHLLQWGGNPDPINTKDKTYIWVDTFARWKIVNADKFMRTIGRPGLSKEDCEVLGNRKLDDIIDPAVRNAITSNSLIEAVRKSNRTLQFYDEYSSKGRDGEEENWGEWVQFTIEKGREKITSQIQEQSQPKITEFGIELVDVKIKRINYEDQVRESVYNRMIAERRQIAEKFRSEGRGEANKITGEKEWKLKEIESQAYQKAQEIKGRADAEATAVYAAAFGKDPDFYSFLKTMEIYGNSFEDHTAVVLSTDSDLMRYIKNYRGTPAEPHP
ncbi:MAG: HflC protein [Desulfobacterales bacterium]|nr:MAG: HflC protein [Desulfobacterales bacterium]